MESLMYCIGILMINFKTRSDILQGQALFRGVEQKKRKREKEKKRKKEKREEDRRKKVIK